MKKFRVFKICVWTPFVLFVIGLMWHGMSNANKEENFRLDIKTCLDVTQMEYTVPSDVTAYCKDIDAEVERRKLREMIIDIQYLQRRSEED